MLYSIRKEGHLSHQEYVQKRNVPRREMGAGRKGRSMRHPVTAAEAWIERISALGMGVDSA